MSEADETIEVFAFTIESTKINTTREEFAGYQAVEELGDAYDYRLSDMDGETFIVSPDGQVLKPYGGKVDLMEQLRPILDHVAIEEIEIYYVRRTGQAE